MSEIMKKYERPIYRIDAWPFVVAFIGGPLLVTALTFWLFYIPLIALMMGGPVYVVIGLPVALYHLRFNPGTTESLIGLAIRAVLIGAAPVTLLSLIATGPESLGLILFLGTFAIIFAVAWAGAAAAIYQRLRSPQSRKPIGYLRNGGCYA